MFIRTNKSFMQTRDKCLYVLVRALYKPEINVCTYWRELYAHQRLMFVRTGKSFIIFVRTGKSFMHTRDKCLYVLERALCTPEIKVCTYW